jgi:hypothetical protein
MCAARIRKSDGPGGLKFKRNLAIDWLVETELTVERVVGSDGDLICAVSFGDPCSSDTKGPISILETPFQYYQLSPDVFLESSTGNKHKLVDGPFFKLSKSDLTNELKSLASLGAWSFNLPPDCHLNLVLKNLVSDGVYQIRCMFIDGKNKVSPKLFLGPENHEINYDRQSGCIAVGTFTSPTTETIIKIASTTTTPPHINAVVLRRIGYNPRVGISGLRTISSIR